MAMAISDDGLKGFRHIEEASGLTDDTLLKVIPQAGESTTLLTCTNRGRFAYEEQERRCMDLQLRPYRSSAGHTWSYSSNSTTDQESKSSNPLEDLGNKISGVRGMSKDVLDLLDPSLDIWKNASEGSHERQEFGDTGWALAVVTGMEPTELTLDDVGRITRVGERQARRIVEKLERWKWARRVRRGRRVMVVVDFSPMAYEDAKADYLKFERRSRKALIHQHEGKALRRLGSRLGRLVRDVWRNKEAEIRMFLDWAKEAGGRCFNRVITILNWKTRREDPLNGVSRWIAENALAECFRGPDTDLTA